MLSAYRPPPPTEDEIAHRRALSAARSKRYRQAHPGRSRVRSSKCKPFIGIDGEGGGTDHLGRQNYLLMHAAGEHYDAELFDGNRRLSTEACLEFILSLPADAILVGYFFSYDATQIIRDLPPKQIARLFEPREAGPGLSPYVFWKGYAIEFRPRQYFRVARAVPVPMRNRMGNNHPGPLWGYRTVAGTSRTVNEVGGFFQSAFVKQLNDWKIGTKRQREIIAANKDRREQFDRMTRIERNYCRMECEMLAELMTKFRDVCADPEVNCVPQQWRGAGHLSAALHKMHGTPNRKTLARPSRFEFMAALAYYGGRFEVTRPGFTKGPVHEYDINSAYPSAMLRLFCPVHTKFKLIKRGGSLPSGQCYLADINFSHPNGVRLCGLPFRTKGHLIWPRMGRGTYWSVEIEAAKQLGMEVAHVNGGYIIESSRCECHAYDWVEHLFQKRKSLGKTTRGYPLKLGLNGLYGKFAQRLGGAPYRDMAAAGFITAQTRAWLIEAAASAPDSVLMLATDGIFATEELNVPIGDQLGQWEHKIRDDLFIVQPGIYWSSNSDTLPKTRGIPRSKIIEHRQSFEHEWHRYVQAGGMGNVAGFPTVAVPVTNFIGHRMALARGKPEIAGSWRNEPKTISFDWTNKRSSSNTHSDGAAIWTLPFDGSRDSRSAPYDPAILTELEEQAMLDEAADDHIQWGNSGE